MSGNPTTQNLFVPRQIPHDTEISMVLTLQFVLASLYILGPGFVILRRRMYLFHHLQCLKRQIRSPISA